jgi:hypothetical protein
MGISLPRFFFAMQFRTSIAQPMSPLGSNTMSHDSRAISPARNPAFTDNNIINRFRIGYRVAPA